MSDCQLELSVQDLDQDLLPEQEKINKRVCVVWKGAGTFRKSRPGDWMKHLANKLQTIRSTNHNAVKLLPSVLFFKWRNTLQSWLLQQTNSHFIAHRALQHACSSWDVHLSEPEMVDNSQGCSFESCPKISRIFYMTNTRTSSKQTVNLKH